MNPQMCAYSGKLVDLIDYSKYKAVHVISAVMKLQEYLWMEDLNIIMVIGLCLLPGRKCILLRVFVAVF
jgi:hypothetical protein